MHFLTPQHSVDYFFVRKGNVHVPSLYDPKPGATYSYWKGFNLRMYGAWAIGVAMVIHGLAGSYHAHTSEGSVDMYHLGFILAFTAGGVFYYLFCYIWPINPYPAGCETLPRSFEYLGPTDGYLEEEGNVIEARQGSEDLDDGLPPMEKVAKTSAAEI